MLVEVVGQVGKNLSAHGGWKSKDFDEFASPEARVDFSLSVFIIVSQPSHHNSSCDNTC
jgi:hypothetical protein